MKMHDFVADRVEICASTSLADALFACASAPPVAAPPQQSPHLDYSRVAAELEHFIRHEMVDKQLPALSIALVDDQGIAWAQGFGHASSADSIPATAKTVYRVGSISKLLTGIAVIRFVEPAALDLDAPIQHYLPHFRPANSYPTSPASKKPQQRKCCRGLDLVSRDGRI